MGSLHTAVGAFKKCMAHTAPHSSTPTTRTRTRKHTLHSTIQMTPSYDNAMQTTDATTPTTLIEGSTCCISPFNPYGKRLGDPSCLQCVLHKCMDVDGDDIENQSLDPNEVLLQCTAFFTSDQAERDEQALAYYVKLFTDLAHCMSHEGPPERTMLLRLLDCGGRMLMAVSGMYPNTLSQCARSAEEYRRHVRILTSYGRQDDGVRYHC